ncbi:MAG: glycosyltransferase, partial [Bacteroidota bacterium]
MSNPLISIIMPVKNTAVFLTDCLNTIVRQTEAHWELLAINDHSTDNSWEILRQYAQRDSRVKVINNDGKGIIAALRLAYRNSQGQLITRMDSDDKMMPEKLAILKQQLLQGGTGHLATGLVQYFSENKLGDGYQKYQNWLNDLTLEGANFRDIYKECVIPSPCWMVHRSDLEKCDAFRPDQYPEDYDLCFRFYENNLMVLPNNQI